MSLMPRPRSVALLLAASLALLAACAPGGETTPPSPSATAPQPSSTIAPSPPSSAGSATPSAAASLPPFDPTSITLALEPVAELPGRPIGLANAGDASGRLFVVEQGGTIRILRGGAVVAEPFLDLSASISAGGERGLLGLAFHPDHPSDPRFFVNYTDRAGDTVVSSFAVRPDEPDRADPASEMVVLRIDQPYGNHNGGALAFDPDGYLLVATGDGGSAGDPHDNGQRLDTLLGKILRLDIDEATDGRKYGIPAENPFVGRGNARPEIWLYGLRNPWRIAIDRATGDLWMGDVGQGSYEEIDVHRAGSAGGANYGWARMEGFHCYPSGDGCERPELRLPVAEYGHDQGCSVTGGTVYRGAAFPALVGGYVFSDYCSGRLWVVDAARDERQEPRLVAESGRSIASFGEDEAGELYVADAGGAVLRVIVAAN
jgi:glucose/arabinose dehydrogenase